MIYAIDFDGVVHDNLHPIVGRKMGPPVKGAIESLTRLKNEKHTIIIHSVWGHPSGAATIAKWMNYYGIPFDEITNVKPKADVYLDDRGMKFTSWDDFDAALKVPNVQRREDTLQTAQPVD